MAPATTPLLYWHTVRHLRRRQILGQMRARLRARFERPDRLQRRGFGPFPGASGPSRAPWLDPRGTTRPAAELRSGRFTFLEHTIDLGWPPRWSGIDAPRLWLYHLHYFDWIWALDYEPAREAARDWMRRHDARRGRTGWEPYPLSLRLMNWLGFFWQRHRERTLADAPFRDELWNATALHAEWLRRRLEFHLLGNHLLENAAALALAGSGFDGPLAEGWRRTGGALLDEELREQVLADGMHFERSPMYHQRLVYLALTLVSAGDEPLSRALRPLLARMLEALADVLHPDGGIALLNDSALGVYTAPRELLDAGAVLLGAAQAARRGAWALPEAGYYGFRDESGNYVVCDAAPIGPDYLPGHAHGDIFSIELSLAGRRVVVDSGVHDYEEGDLRRYCRSTRAHNTVEIEDRDQCEFWGAFRVARRGRPRDVVWEPDANGFRLAGWHDGYRRLPGAPRHERELRWSAGTLDVTDRVRAGRPVRGRTRLHLHPDCRVERMSEREAEVAHPGGRLRVAFHGPGRLAQEASHYCPRFGVRLDNVALAFSWHESSAETGFRLEPA